MRRFGQVLGLTCGERATPLASATERGVASHVETRAPCSLEGPPYFELVQNLESGVLGHDHEGLHFPMAYQIDVNERIEALSAAGVGSKAVFQWTVGFSAYLKGTDVHSTHLEIVEPRDHP
jgi:hypothetical protein